MRNLPDICIYPYVASISVSASLKTSISIAILMEGMLRHGSIFKSPALRPSVPDRPIGRTKKRQGHLVALPSIIIRLCQSITARGSRHINAYVDAVHERLEPQYLRAEVAPGFQNIAVNLNCQRPLLHAHFFKLNKNLLRMFGVAGFLDAEHNRVL
jgi:hypothetical protein